MSNVPTSPHSNSGTHQKPLFSFSSWNRQTWGLVAGAFAAALIVLWIVLSARGQSADSEKANGKFKQEKSDKGATHQGKTASEWIEQLKAKDLDDRQSAAKALLAIGAGAKSTSAQLEAAIKDSAWDFATTLLPDLGENAEATFETVGSTIKPPSEEEKRKAEEKWEARRRKERESRAKLEKWSGYMTTLLQALEKADPERMERIKGKVVLEVLTPKTTNTFKSVGDRVESSVGPQR
jgi:hypothetical protein